MKRNDIIGLVVAIAAFAGAVAFILSKNLIITSQAIEITLLFALVLVTIIYAKRTSEIADATKKQAEEMRNARFSESLPLLVPDIIRGSITAKTEPNEVEYRTLQTGIGLEVIWHNLGKGVAINARFSLWSVPLDSHPDKVIYFPPRESTFLEIGGRHKIEFKEEWKGQWFDQPESYKPRLEAEYRDIYERNITTAQEFRIDEQNKKVFLGDLYFTVNGKRLGEEATRQ